MIALSVPELASTLGPAPRPAAVDPTGGVAPRPAGGILRAAKDLDATFDRLQARDAEVVTRHVQLQTVNYEAVGRTLFGLESNSPLF